MEFSLTWADLLSIFVGYIVVRWLTKSVKITYTYNDDDIEDVKEEIFEAVDAKHIRMRIERECGTLLAYDVNTNSFVAQALQSLDDGLDDTINLAGVSGHWNGIDTTIDLV